MSHELEGETEELSMITISAFKDRDEALIGKALLEAAGVPVTLRDEFGELQLQVRDTDAQLAQDVLVPCDASWRRRNPLVVRDAALVKNRVGRQFLKGGCVLTAGFILFLLALMPLGISFHVSPFPLFFLFVFGGCAAVVRKFFKIKSRKPLRLSRQL